MGRFCEKCQRIRDYHPFEKRNSMFSGFYKNICWDCHTTEQILKDIEKRRERQYKNMEYAPSRARYASTEEGKEAQKRANRKYLASEKGKIAKSAANARYRAKMALINPAPKAPRETLPSFLLTPPKTPEEQKAANRRYQQSDKGKATKAASNARYRAKKALEKLPEWLK